MDNERESRQNVLEESKKTEEKEDKGSYMALGLLIGAVVGFAGGWFYFESLTFENIVMGIGAGMGLGLIIGSTIKKK